MWNSLFSLMFIVGALSGTWIAIFSDSWLGVWAGLELNLLSFIPFLIMESKALSEISVKYFLIQACGSMVLLFSGVIFSFGSVFLMFISFALLLKLGAAPFHFWYPEIAEELNWSRFILLSTLQKLAPLVLLFYSEISVSSKAVYLFAISSGAVGALGGLNEMSTRKLLAFSSINHLGWMLISISENNEAWMIYFSIYILLLLLTVMALNNENTFHLNQLVSVKVSFYGKISIILSLLSLGGLPPLLGFLPKWFLIQNSVSFSVLVGLTILILSSVVTLFYYTRLGSNVLMFKHNNTVFQSTLSYKVTSLIVTISLVGFMVSEMVISSFLH